MLKLLKTAVLGTSAVAAIAATMPAAAHADGLAFEIRDGGPRIGLYLDDDEDGPPRGRWDRDRDDDDDDWGHGPGWRHRPPPPRCSPGQALAKAQRMGLRRPRIVDVDRRTIDVSGRKYGERYVVTFARAPFCPVIR